MIRRDTLGVSIGADGLRIAMLRGSAIVWVLDDTLGDGVEAGAMLRALLHEAPAPARRGSQAMIAIEEPLAQVRQIEGLPPVDDDRAVLDILRGSPLRWFLGRTGGLSLGQVHTDVTGARWAAAYPRSLVEELTHALEQSGYRPVLTTAGSVARLGVVEPGLVTIGSPRSPHVLSITGTGTISIARTDDAAAVATASMVPTPLDPLGERAHEFACAVGAATLAARATPVPFAILHARRHRAPVSAVRARAAVVAASVGVVAALAGYPVSVGVTSARLARLDGARDPARIRSDSIALGLAAANAEIQSLEDRLESRVSVITLLDQLRSALPGDAAIVAFRLDSSEAQLTIVGPRIGAVVDRLAESGAVRSVRLLGAMTTEAVGTRLLERASITLGLMASPGGIR